MLANAGSKLTQYTSTVWICSATQFAIGSCFFRLAKIIICYHVLHTITLCAAIDLPQYYVDNDNSIIC